jgi:hypothetical protein
MGRGVDMPWVGGQNTMDRVVDIPLLRSQNTMGRGITMPCVGGRNTMDRGSKYIKYIEPLIHVIFNPYPWYIDPLYPWYFDPPTHGIFTSLLKGKR